MYIYIYIYIYIYVNILSIPRSCVEWNYQLPPFFLTVRVFFFSLTIFVVDVFLKISAVFDGDQMTLCLSTLGTAQYLTIN